jgi:hypothetical protein
MWKWCGRKTCGLISNPIPPFGWGTDKFTQTCQNSRSAGRGLFLGPSVYEAVVLRLDCNVRSFVPFENSRQTARKRKDTRVLDVNLAFVERWRLNLYELRKCWTLHTYTSNSQNHYFDGDSNTLQRKTKLRNTMRN